jgi:transcriptional regulator with GAF, ATPase, and Fis domain
MRAFSTYRGTAWLVSSVPLSEATIIGWPCIRQSRSSSRITRTPEGDVSSTQAWLLDALRRHSFHRTEAAAFLGISRKTLYNKMKRLRLLQEH